MSELRRNTLFVLLASCVIATAAMATCPTSVSLQVQAMSPALAQQAQGLQVGDRFMRWRDASGSERDLCTLLDLARAELELGTRAPITVSVARAGAVATAQLSGGRHEMALQQRGDTPQARAGISLLALREQALAGDFVGARAALDSSPALSDSERALQLELALAWLEADPDREATGKLAARVLDLRRHAPPRERARALALRGRANLLRRDLAAAALDATQAVELIGDERSLISAQIELLLGALDYLNSRHDEAERHYLLAIQALVAIAPRGIAHANALSNLAALQVARGQPAQALAGYGEALDILAQAAPGSYSEARVHYNRGLALTELRRLSDAEADVVAAVERFAGVQPNGPEHLQAQAQLADIYNARGQHPLAEARLRVLLPALQAQDAEAYNTLAVEYTLAHTLTRLKRHDESAQAFRRLLAKLSPDRSDSLRADTLNAYGQTLAEGGSPEDAVATLSEALSLYQSRQRLGLPMASALIARGSVLRRQGKLDAAAADLQQALDLRAHLAPGSVLEAVAHHALGKLSRARGENDAAMTRYHRAIEMLERERWLQSESAELRALWTASYADFYREPLDLLLELGRLPEAFELDQRYRSRELAVAMARTGQGIDPALVPESVSSVANARATLREAQAAIAFVTLETHTWAVLFDRDRLQAQRLPKGKAHWRAQIDALKVLWALPQPNAASQRATIERSQRLYLELFGAWDEQLDRTERLLLLPDDALHELAFAALVVETGERAADARYLVERHALATAVRPFAQDSLPVPVESRLLALGDPLGARVSSPSATPRLRGVGDTPLPAARREAIEIADLYGKQGRVLVGMEANEASVASSDSSLLHFATHIVLDPLQPLDSHVVLAAGANSDGLLSAREIIEAPRVSRELVVLAGCASAQGANAAGEGLLGIARAWHVAGARRVLASSWAIEDEATSRFMIGLHRELRSEIAPDLALARTQRAWLANARDGAWWRSDRSMEARPFYWAGFLLSSTQP